MLFNVGGVLKPASYVAKQIHHGWVDEASKGTLQSFGAKVPEEQHELFLMKMYLYCEAAALRVLLIEFERNARYDELVREFEKLIFRADPTQEGFTKLEAIKSAMKELDLLFTEKKEHSWSRRWLKGIGRDETNPARLVTFALLMQQDTTSLRKLIHEIGLPVG